MTTTYQANVANQYAQIATGTEVVGPAYDEFGNLLEDDRNTYLWDADIHLASVTHKADADSQRNWVSEKRSARI
ncbi:MAG: hypothetical protein KDK99_17265 [Verrucomicrobiales bacterium]|nr:hypothetical protein [Verrucomicrobiales bacterium]